MAHKNILPGSEVSAAFKSVLPTVIKKLTYLVGEKNVPSYLGIVYETFAARFESLPLDKFSLKTCLKYVLMEAMKASRSEASLIYLPAEKLMCLYKALGQQHVIEAGEDECSTGSDDELSSVADEGCNASASEFGPESDCEVEADGQDDVLYLSGVVYPKSLDEPIHGSSSDDEEDGVFCDTIADTLVADDCAYSRSEAREKIRACVAKLLFEGSVTDEDAKCFFAVYCPENEASFGFTLADLAEDLGYTPQCMRYHVEKVVKLLKDPDGPYRPYLATLYA